MVRQTMLNEEEGMTLPVQKRFRRGILSLVMCWLLGSIQLSAEAATADLLMEPVAGQSTYQVGRLFAFDLVVDTDSSTLMHGLEARVLFPASACRLVALEKLPTCPFPVQVGSVGIDNQGGTGIIVLGTLASSGTVSAKGRFAFARATFAAVVADASVSLSYCPDSKVAFSGVDITGARSGFGPFALQPAPPVGGGGTVDLVLTPDSLPPTTKLYQTKDITVTVAVSADAGQYVDGVSCYLNYDPSTFALVSPLNLSLCPLKQVLHNTAPLGQLNLALGAVPGSIPPKGSFPVVTFTLRVKEQGATKIRFARDPERWTDVAYAGGSLLRLAMEGDYEMRPLRGLVRLKVGRTGGAVANLPVEVWVHPSVGYPLSDDHASWDKRNLRTDGTGIVEFSMDYPGSFYRVFVKKAKSLWRCRELNGTPVPGGATPTPVDMGVLQEGDANEDDRINILDFSILAGTYNKKKTDPGFDPRGDVNDDGLVNMTDYSLLSANFGGYVYPFSEKDEVSPSPKAQDNASSGGGCSGLGGMASMGILGAPLLLLGRRKHRRS